MNGPRTLAEALQPPDELTARRLLALLTPQEAADDIAA